MDELYHAYLASVLERLQVQDRTGEIDRALATLPRCGAGERAVAPQREDRHPIAHRELKLRGDFGCARVRERLWRLHHLPFDLSVAGQGAR